MAAEPPRCQHAHCHCSVSAGERYCSSYCANAAHQSEIPGACACGHPECGERMRAIEKQGAGTDTTTSLGHRPDSDPPESASD